MTRENKLQRAYEALAITYDAHRDLFDMQSIIANFQARLSEGGTLLDLGCGAGEPFARTFLERGWEVTGVDFCPAMLALAERYCPEMTRIESDMREVRFAPGRFDAVTLVYSLFHIPRADHPALLARIRDWLRPGGRLLFTYATQAYTGQERFEGYRDFMGQPLFYSHTTPSELAEQLSAAGLGIVEAIEREIGGERFLWVTARRADEPLAGPAP